MGAVINLKLYYFSNSSVMDLKYCAAIFFTSFSVLSLKMASTQFSLMLNLLCISASSLHCTKTCIWISSCNLQNLHFLS